MSCRSSAADHRVTDDSRSGDDGVSATGPSARGNGAGGVVAHGRESRRTRRTLALQHSLRGRLTVPGRVPHENEHDAQRARLSGDGQGVLTAGLSGESTRASVSPGFRGVSAVFSAVRRCLSTIFINLISLYQMQVVKFTVSEERPGLGRLATAPGPSPDEVLDLRLS